MILRRLAEAISEQNWFTVVLEVLIVVVGIFIGLQVDDWNERRKDRALEHSYLLRISEDLHEDVDVLANLSGTILNKQDALIRITAAVNQGGFRGDPVEMLTLIQVSTSLGWQVPWVQRSTFDEILSTGRIVLVSDAGTRAEIQDYYKRAKERLERIDRRLTGYAPMIYELADADDMAGFLTEFRDSDVVEPDPDRIGALPSESVTAFLSAASDPDVLQLMNAERNYATFLLVMVDDQRKDVEQLRGVLDDAIEGSN